MRTATGQGSGRSVFPLGPQIAPTFHCAALQRGHFCCQATQLGKPLQETAMTNNSKMVTGLFRDSESVERAYEIVSQRDYGMADINVVMSEDTRRRYFSDDRQINTQLGRKVAEGGELGGPMGATIGMI